MRPVRTSLVVLLAFVMRIVVAPAVGRAADEIPRLRGVHSLDHVDPVRVGDWNVTLGVHFPAGEIGPWQLLYCRAAWVGDGDAPDLSTLKTQRGHPIGPVTYEADWGDGPQPPFDGGARRDDWSAPRRAPLYVTGVPLNRAGRCTLRVFDADGTLLRESTIEMAEPCAYGWQTFAESEEQPGGGFAMVATTGLTLPACPSQGWARGINRFAVAHDPGEPALTLAMRDGRFVVTAPKDAEPMVDRPDIRLIARWWRNDQPVQAPIPASVMRDAFGAIRDTHEMTIGFGLPAILRDAKPGDHIGLQVAYCPGGFEFGTRPEETAHTVRAAEPAGRRNAYRVSNRIDFELTAEMVGQVERARRATATQPAE
jgi:hypothetical protein